MKYLGTVLLVAVCLCAAQSSPTPSPRPAGSPKSDVPPKIESLATLVKQQFGPTFALTPMTSTAILTADLDGDGVEDVVLVADSTDPLPDSYQFKYAVSDPYNSFFGFGNPRQTAGYGRSDPGHSHDLLVIFGAGPDSWRAATPKAKFVLINIPFDRIEIGRLMVKKNKPPVFMIRAVESRLMDSSIYYDVKKKKWKWQPGDTVE
jgi:hypothetical protein